MALSKASIFQIQIHQDPDSQKQSFSLVLRPPTADDVVDTLVVALHPSSFQSPDRLLLDLSEIATQRFLRVAASALYQTCDTLQDAFSTQSDLHTALGMIFQPLAPVVVLSVSESSYCLCLLLQYLSTLVNPSPSTETLLQADSYGMVFICSIIITLKLLRDSSPPNHWWATLYRFPTSALFLSEQTFLTQLDFHLHPPHRLFKTLSRVLSV